MKNFIEGIVFIVIIVPFLEGIVSIINQAIECICTKIAVITYKMKQQITEDVPQQTRVIGFQAPENEIIDYDDDQEEEP